MHFQINNYITLDLAFKTEPASPSVVEKFEYIENVQTALPTCRIILHVRDSDTEFISNSIYDGAALAVKVNHSKIDAPIFLQLLIFGTPKIEPDKTLGEGHTLDILAILSSYKYLTGVTQTAYKGSVSSVLSTLARECGLQTSIVQTGELQTWFSYGKTYKNMAQHLVDHCYMSSKSLPVFGITHPNTIIFKDVTSELKRTAQHTLKYIATADPSQNEDTRLERADTSNEYVFSTHESKNVSGILNSTGTYGNVYLQDSIITANSFENSLIDLDRTIKNSEINSIIKSSVKNTSIRYLPIDMQNTYSDYYKAYEKNQRLRTVYSNVLKVILIDNYSKIHLLDTVNILIDEKYESGKELMFGGKYIVTQKTVIIVKNLYREVLTLVNYGRNMDTSDLV